MDAKTYIDEKIRMCESYNPNCEACPTNGFCTYSQIKGNAEKAIRIVSEWSAANPVATYKSDFLSKFPKGWLRDDSVGRNSPGWQVCRKAVYGQQKESCGKLDCTDCWNQPLPKEGAV